MLEGVARWLRILGYDVARDTSVDDAELVRRAVGEHRRILTRDLRSPDEWRIEGIVVVESEEPLVQLREVVARIGLEPDEERAFTRCPECNAELEGAAPAEVEADVPDRLLGEQATFRRRPGCGKVYWEGGHVRRMRKRLEELWA